MSNQHETGMKLKAEVLERFRTGELEWPVGTKLWLKIKQVTQQRRGDGDERKVRVHSRKYYGVLKEGGPVPPLVMEVFAAMLGVPVEAISDPTRDSVDLVEGPWWAKDWAFYFEHMLFNFTLPKLAFCSREDDFKDMALMVWESCGRAEHGGDNKMSVKHAVEAGERLMGRRWTEYAEQLKSLHKVTPYGPMFAVAKGIYGDEKRVGACVIYPLSETASVDWRAGRLTESDLIATGLQVPTDWILFQALGEVNQKAFANRTRISQAQMRTINNQLARLFYSKVKRRAKPVMLGFAATPKSEERMLAKSFSLVGTKTPDHQHNIMEFSKPRLRAEHFIKILQYRMMAYTVSFCRTAVELRERLFGPDDKQFIGEHGPPAS